MPSFVIFVFGAIVFGAGAMLAPAIPTRGPRIGLAAAVTLAFITAGAIFYACLFGWNTLVIDYMWFAALVGIFLTGTLSAGMFRAEAEGGTREYSGWPGPRELLFFGTVAVVFIVPALILPVPLDTDAQGFGYLGLTVRDSGSFTTLAPWHSEVNWLYSPGFPTLIAYLSDRLSAGIHVIQKSLGAIFCIAFVWLAYDFGNEIDPDVETDSRRYGMVFGFTALIGLGLFLAYMDSHFTALLGLVFALAFITFAIRFLREGRRTDFIGAAICLSGMPLAQPDMTIVLGFGFVPWLVTVWFAKPRPKFREFLPRWLGLAVGVPLVAVLGILPWLLQIVPLLGSNIASPFEISLSHLVQLTVYHGGVVVILSVGGILIGLRRRNMVDLLMIVWLLLVIDFSTFGILERLGGPLLAPILKYDYPFSVAWHGPIIPYIYLSGTAIIWLIDRRKAFFHNLIQQLSLPFMVTLMVASLTIMSFIQPILEWSKSTPFMMFGAFSSAADVAAMQWLRENTPQDAIILNHPGLHEADWVPLISERQSIFFRMQPFFQHTEAVEAVQAQFRAFWLNPTDPSHEVLLRQHGIDYVIIPQVFANPASLDGMFRWRPPLPDAAQYEPEAVTEVIPYLELVFDQEGARIFRVKQASN